MMTISITKEQMIIDINDKLTCMAESITCGGAERMEEGWYRFLTGFINSKGETVNIKIPHTCINEGYHLYGKSILPKHLIEVIKSEEALIRVWKHIKGIN